MAPEFSNFVVIIIAGHLISKISSKMGDIFRTCSRNDVL